MPVEPASPEQWQEAVNAARFCLLLDAAISYGLVERVDDTGRMMTGSDVDTDRCLEILERSAELGYEPTSSEVPS